jgi:hypothetical protein
MDQHRDSAQMEYLIADFRLEVSSTPRPPAEKASANIRGAAPMLSPPLLFYIFTLIPLRLTTRY